MQMLAEDLVSGGETESPPLFKIVSAHICESDGIDKKHVVYTLQVRHVAHSLEMAPLSTIERRYTDFLNLYTGISTEHPDLMSSVTFPKKALMGNFDNSLITSRSNAFETLLAHIMKEDKLRSSTHLLNFLQQNELTKLKQFISNKDYGDAIPLLENSFMLLNNVYTDRSTPVLLSLCRLLGCCCLTPGYNQSEKWADLALHRFDGVSDSDLLVLYTPMLQTCVKVYRQIGKDKTNLEQTLSDLKRRGFFSGNSVGLLEAVTKVEINLTER